MVEREVAHLERFLDLLSARHRVLASNIANADTPGFRSQDFDFRAEFKKAIQKMETGTSLPPMKLPELYDTLAISPSRDGNTVSMEVEMAKMSENTMLYNAIAQALSMELNHIKDAIVNSQ